MTTFFHDMIHDCVEDYIDNLLVKSRKNEGHLEHLRRVFERCQEYDIRINLLKCAFEVITGKFLGFIIDDGVSKSRLS